MQSIRIVVGFGQVVGQLGSVLHVEYPETVTTLLAKVKNAVSFELLEVFVSPFIFVGVLFANHCGLKPAESH